MKTKNIIFNFIFNRNEGTKKNILEKYIFFSILLILIISLLISDYNNKIIINEKYIQMQKDTNLTFNNNINRKINIAIYGYCIANGGRARITSILANFFYTIKLFKTHIFTVEDKTNNEYTIPQDIKRFVIKKNIIKILKKNRIDILIYQLDYINEIEILNNLKKIKIIFYHHSSHFYRLYSNYTYFKILYKSFKNSKYIISIIPFENDYLFKYWGIKSILFYNFLTYEYNLVIPSDLSSNSILMIGRGQEKCKRFELGIQAMELIILENPNFELLIISNLTRIENLQNLVINLNLSQYIIFKGFNKNPELFFKNSTLHFFPSISEAFPMVVIETKLFGIPNILIGLDYLSISKGGTFIIYDDTPESLARISLKILTNKLFIKQLGVQSKKSMKKYHNEYLKLKWIKLLLSIYNGEKYYDFIREQTKKLSEFENFQVINNQIELLKIRDTKFENITINNYKNFSFMENIK